jgi:hypothetical protein
MGAKIVRFDSVDAFADKVAAVGKRAGQFWGARGACWDGGVGGDDALRMAREGSSAMATSTLANLTHLESTMGASVRSRFAPSVAGSRVCVPDYLSGRPTCMRRRTRVESESRHVNVYVSLASQGGVRAADLLARGAAVLALLEYLQASGTSVDLYLLAELADGQYEDYWQVIRVETRPLDLSTSGFAIGHPAFGRHLTYAYAEATAEVEYTGQWSRRAHDLGKGSERWCNYIRAELGLAPTDILVPYTRDYDQIVTDPAAWLAARVSQLSGEGTAGAA